MTAKANLTLAKLLTENYIDSADSASDLVYFTVEAYDKLDEIVKTLYKDTMTAEDVAATRDQINVNLTLALQKKLGL